MDALALLALVLFGVLVICQVIPTGKVGTYLTALILVIMFAPILFGIAGARIREFLAAPHHVWEYVLGLLIILGVIRIIVNLLSPRRRRN